MNTWCTIFGHKMITVDGDNVAGPLKCARDNCDHTAVGVEWSVSMPVKMPDRGFPEDSEQENGNYVNKCGDCDCMFTGNKHRRRCRVCRDELMKSTGIHVRKKNGLYYVYNGVQFIGALNMIPPQASDDCCREFLEGSIHQCGCDACTPNKWQPVDQHDTIGWCWIKYKGRVRHAWHKGDRWFMFSEHGMTGCYMTECISGVIAIEVPTL